jgi:hypothetical protein
MSEGADAVKMWNKQTDQNRAIKVKLSHYTPWRRLRVEEI